MFLNLVLFSLLLLFPRHLDTKVAGEKETRVASVKKVRDDYWSLLKEALVMPETTYTTVGCWGGKRTNMNGDYGAVGMLGHWAVL